MTRAHFATSTLAVAALAGFAAAQENTHDALAPTETVYSCWADEQGRLSGSVLELPIDAGPLPAVPRAHVEVLSSRSAVGDLIDLVFIGDGYTESELAQFDVDVDRFLLDLWKTEPFSSYRSYFRVSRVDVISNESGVDNDPTRGVSKDTALDMAYWCSGIERLLCISTNKARAFANQAGEVDHVVAIANASKYGGAGYISQNIATASARNFWSTEVTIHEMGHSVGDLADEYWTNGATYSGGEVPERNVSIKAAADMASQGVKWADWLGDNIPALDGVHSTFEGARYNQFGIYRPTASSKMNVLNNPFNGPSVEGLILAFYRDVSPIADATPAEASLSSTSSVWVTPMQPVGHDLEIAWTIDGLDRPALDGQAVVDLASLGLDHFSHEVVVTVWDPTDWVRDEAARSLGMTESLSWVVNECASLVNLNGDGVLDFFDVQVFLVAFAAGDLSADLTGDGVLDIFDVSKFLELYAAGCL